MSMRNWIYIERSVYGFLALKAAALASALNNAEGNYYVVRSSETSSFFAGLKNVSLGFPNIEDGDTITRLTLPDYAPFDMLCKMIAKALGIDTCCEIRPYLGFAREDNMVDREMAKYSQVALFAYYLENRDIAIANQLENSIRLLPSSVKAICCGSRNEKLLRGALDFRGLIQIDELIKNKQRISAIVTASHAVKEIALLLGIRVLFVYENTFLCYENGRKSTSFVHDVFSEQLAHSITASNDSLYVEQSLSNVMKKFELPYNFDLDLIDYYSTKSNFVEYLYLPPYADDSINARTCMENKHEGLSYMPHSRQEYEYHLESIKKSGLKYVVLWQDRNQLLPKRLLDYYTKLGASGFIIANDKNAKIIKDYNSQLIVVSSIVRRLCDNITKMDFSFYDYIVLFYPFTRSLDCLRKLSKLRDKLIIMPNSHCHTDCCGEQHWFAKDINEFDPKKSCPAYCNYTRSTFIHPEHLHVFDKYVAGYKLQGRENRTSKIIAECESYFYRKSYSNILALDERKELLENLKDKTLEEYYNIKTPEIIGKI